MSRLLLLILTVMLSLAIAPASPIPQGKKKPPLYFPTKVGAKWVYQTEGNKNERIEVVMAVKEKDGAKLVTVGHEIERKVYFDNVLSVSDKGLCIVDTSVSPLSEPMWLLRLPHKEGNKWDVAIAPVVFGKLTGSATADGPVKVEVPAGKFEAIRTRMLLAHDDGQVAITTWYAPGIGKVKEVQDGAIKSIEVLKSFTQGKE